MYKCRKYGNFEESGIRKELKMTNFTIKGTGSYIPEFVLDNEILEKMVDTSDEWITKRVGVKERRISQGESTWYMGKIAAERAIEDANISKDDIGLIMVSTVTPDYYFPSAAAIIQGELGIKNAACFDVSAACTGFIYCLDIAEKYIKTGVYKNILIISSEILSKVVDYSDRSTCVLFGDAAGACVVSAEGEGKMLSSYIAADGTGAGRITSKALAVNSPFVNEEYVARFDIFPETTDNRFRQDGQEVFKFAVNAMCTSCEEVMKRAGLTVDEIDFLIPHQANVRIIDFATKKLKLDSKKVAKTIKNYGNTSSASIPVALDLLKKEGKIKRGDKIIFSGFGSGLTYGATLIKF